MKRLPSMHIYNAGIPMCVEIRKARSLPSLEKQVVKAARTARRATGRFCGRAKGGRGTASCGRARGAPKLVLRLLSFHLANALSTCCLSRCRRGLLSHGREAGREQIVECTCASLGWGYGRWGLDSRRSHA